MMRCMLRTNRTTQDSSSVQLRSEGVLTDAAKAFSSVRLTEQANLKTAAPATVPDLVATAPDLKATHQDLVATHQDLRFAATSAFLKT